MLSINLTESNLCFLTYTRHFHNFKILSSYKCQVRIQWEIKNIYSTKTLENFIDPFDWVNLIWRYKHCRFCNKTINLLVSLPFSSRYCTYLHTYEQTRSHDNLPTFKFNNVMYTLIYVIALLQVVIALLEGRKGKTHKYCSYRSWYVVDKRIIKI